MESTPLILTLSLDDASQAHFDALRKKYFPPERNFLSAHCTLFHALPGGHVEDIRETLSAISANYPAFAMCVLPPRSIGRGAAFPLDGEPALRIHASLQKRWEDWLTPQDRQRLWPHITVQNKVAPEAAKAALAELSEAHQERTVTAIGLHLWAYISGPWQSIERFPFSDGAPNSASV